MNYYLKPDSNWWTKPLYSSPNRFYSKNEWLSSELRKSLYDAVEEEIKKGIIYNDNGELRWNWKYKNEKPKTFECKSLI